MLFAKEKIIMDQLFFKLRKFSIRNIIFEFGCPDRGTWDGHWGPLIKSREGDIGRPTCSLSGVAHKGHMGSPRRARNIHFEWPQGPCWMARKGYFGSFWALDLFQKLLTKIFLVKFFGRNLLWRKCFYNKKIDSKYDFRIIFQYFPIKNLWQ